MSFSIKKSDSDVSAVFLEGPLLKVIKTKMIKTYLECPINVPSPFRVSHFKGMMVMIGRRKQHQQKTAALQKKWHF